MRKNTAFGNMVDAAHDAMMAFALRLTSDPDRANDLVQDTILKALSNQEKFVDDTNAKGWLMTIMRNTFINNYRRSVRENVVIDTTPDLYQINLCAQEAHQTPEGAFTVNEITRLIESFPPDFRDPFNMHVAGYKYEEISEKLGMPMGTVKSRIFNTRKRLRELLGDYE